MAPLTAAVDKWLTSSLEISWMVSPPAEFPSSVATVVGPSLPWFVLVVVLVVVVVVASDMSDISLSTPHSEKVTLGNPSAFFWVREKVAPHALPFPQLVPGQRT